jgi:hypothetical protein
MHLSSIFFFNSNLIINKLKYNFTNVIVTARSSTLKNQGTTRRIIKSKIRRGTLERIVKKKGIRRSENQSLIGFKKTLVSIERITLRFR